MLSCALVANSAFGQTLKHPASVRPASLSNDSYYGYYYGTRKKHLQATLLSPEATGGEPHRRREPSGRLRSLQRIRFL